MFMGNSQLFGWNPSAELARLRLAVSQVPGPSTTPIPPEKFIEQRRSGRKDELLDEKRRGRS
jgi:hypothetical protein